MLALLPPRIYVEAGVEVKSEAGGWEPLPSFTVELSSKSVSLSLRSHPSPLLCLCPFRVENWMVEKVDRAPHPHLASE